MIENLLQKTNELIIDCAKKEEELFSIENFENSLETIEEELAKVIKEIKQTESLEERTNKTKELLNYLNQYLDWLEGCRKIKVEIKKTGCSKIKECTQLIQFLTIFNTRKNSIKYTNNLEGQIVNLKKILTEMNRFYKALFQIDEDLMFLDILPTEKEEKENIEEYITKVEQFFKEKNKQRIEAFIKDLSESINNSSIIKGEPNKPEEEAEKTEQEIFEEVPSRMDFNEPIFAESTPNKTEEMSPEPLEEILDKKISSKDPNIESATTKLEEMPLEALQENEEIVDKKTSSQKEIPEFLKPYMAKAEEEIAKQSAKLIESRKKAINKYKERLYRQMDIYNQQEKIEALEPGTLTNYQATRPLQETCFKEIKRINSFSEQEINNPNIDLDIPEESVSLKEILKEFTERTPKIEPLPLTIDYPVLEKEKELELLPVVSRPKKAYTRKGMTNPKLTTIIKNRLAELAIASVVFLLSSQKDFLGVAQNFGPDKVIEKTSEVEIDFEKYINLGDNVKLKNLNVISYLTPNLLESVSTKPLYTSDTPRIVEQLFMKSPNNEIIEVHEERERNFYLELGYEILSVKLVDGYYAINDIVSLEMERKNL